MRLTRGEAYSILGLQESSTEDDIRRAYKSQALKWHPDKNQNSTESTERFKSINEAYARLKAQNEDDDEFEMDEDMFDDDMFDDLPHEFFFFFARMMGGQRRRAYTSSVYTTYDAPCDCAQCRMRARASSRSYRTGYGYRDSYSYSPSPPREANRERAEKAREAQSREESEAMERWLQTQLRLKLVSTSDYNIQATLEAVTVPVGCAWEASYRKDADASATWTSVVPKKNGNIYVGSLRPGTDYLFRARPGKSGTYTWSGVAEYTGTWGPSVLLSTTGIAPEYANDGGKKGKKKQGQKQAETTKKEPAAKAARPAQPTEKPSPPQPAPTSPRASGKKSQKGKAAQGNSSTNSTGSTQKEKEQSAEDKEQLRLQREVREAAEREKEEQKKKEKERQAALEKAAHERLRLEELEREKQKEKDRQAAIERAAAEYDRAVEAAAAQRSAVDKRKEREKEREKEKHKEQQEQHKQHKEREAGESKASAEARERVQAEARERAHVEARERAQAEAVAKAEAESALKAEEEDATKTRADEVARYRAKAEALLRQPADNGRREPKGLKVHNPAADEAFAPVAAAPTSSDSANVHHLEPCKYFLRGQCMRGDNCWYLHDQAARDKLMEQKYTRKLRTTPVSSPGIAPVSAFPQVPTTPIVHSMQSTPSREPSTHPVSKFDQGQSSTPGSRPVALVGQERPAQTSPAVRSWKPATVIEDPISALEEKMIAKAIEESLRYQQYYQTAVRLDEQDFPDLTTVRPISKGSDHKPHTPPASHNGKQGFSDLTSNSDSAEHADSAHSLDCADARDLPMSNNSATFSNGDHGHPRPPKVYNPIPNNNTIEGKVAAPGRSMFQEGLKKPPHEGSSRSNSNGHITVPVNGMHGTYDNAAAVGEESSRKAGKNGKVQGADGFQYGSSSDVDGGKDGGERELRYGAGGNGVQYGAAKLANGYTVKGQYAGSGGERHVEGVRGAGAVEPGCASRSGSSARGSRVLQRPGVGPGAGGGSVDDSSGSEKSEKVRERRRGYVGKVMRPFPVPVPMPVTGTRDTSQQQQQQQQQQQHADGGSYPAAAPTSRHSSHIRSMDSNALNSEAPSFTSHLGGNGPIKDSPEVPGASVEIYDSAGRNDVSYSYTKVSAAAKASGGDDGGTKSRPPAGRMPVPVPVNAPPTSYAPPTDATYHDRSKSSAGIGRMPVPVPINTPPTSYAPPSVSTGYQGAKAAAAAAQMPVPVPVNAPPTSYIPPSVSTLYRGAKTAAAAAQMPVPVPVNAPPTSYAPPSGSTFPQGTKVAAAVAQMPVPLPVPVNAPPPSYAGTPAAPQTAAAVQYNGMGVTVRDPTHPSERASSGRSPHSSTPARRNENPATPSAVHASPEEEDLDLLTFGIGFSEMDDQIQEELERENASYDNMGAFSAGFGSFGAAAGQLPGESNLQESFGSYYSSSLPSYNAGALTSSSPSAPAFGSSLPDSMPPGSTNASKPTNNRNEFPIPSPYPGSTLSSSSGLDSQTHSRGLSGSLPPPAHHAFSKITPPPAVAAAFSPASHASHTDFSSASFADWGPPTPGGSTWGPPATLPAAGSLKPPTPNSRGMTHIPPARPRFPVPAPLSLPNGITNPSHLLSPSLSNASMLSPAAKATPNKADISGRAVMTTPPQGGSLTHYADSTSDETSPTAPDSLLNLLISHHSAKLDSHKPATSATNVSSSSPRPSRQNPPARPYNPIQAQNSQALTAATPSATDSTPSTGNLIGQSSGQPAPSGTGYAPPHTPTPVTQPQPATTSTTTSTAATGHTPSATKPMPLPILPDSIDPPVNKAPVITAKPASNPTPSATNSVKHPVTLPPPPAAAALNPNLQYAYFTPAMPHAAFVPNMSYATYPTAVYFDPTTGHPIAPAAPHGQMLAGMGPSYYYPAVPHMVNPGMQFGVNPSGNSGKSAKGNSQERQSGMYPAANAGQPYWPSAIPPANVTGMTFGGQ